MKLLVICRRELSSYFGSVTAYVLLAVFLLLSGYFFYSDLVFFILFGGFTLSSGLWQFFFIDMRLFAMLILPLLTMRLFAEEKKLGTIELLWTYPVRDSEVVLGKFLAAWIFYLVMLVPTAVGPILFHHYHAFDVPPVLAGYLGMLLIGSAFIACGLFVSSLTENQVVSAMVTYGILVLFWFITWNEEAASQAIMHLLLGLSLFDRFFNFTRGVIDTKDVAFFVMFIAFFLFLTWQSLATRSWRGVR
jgi:gliding motility-associated transport system permease protein